MAFLRVCLQGFEQGRHLATSAWQTPTPPSEPNSPGPPLGGFSNKFPIPGQGSQAMQLPPLANVPMKLTDCADLFLSH